MSRIDEIAKSLPADVRERGDKLRNLLEELGVRKGLQDRLIGMSRFGSDKSMIWKYAVDCQDVTVRSRIKDVGAYLYAKMMKGPRWKQDVWE